MLTYQKRYKLVYCPRRRSRIRIWIRVSRNPRNNITYPHALLFHSTLDGQEKENKKPEEPPETGPQSGVLETTC
jgi:hypothetical protein